MKIEVCCKQCDSVIANDDGVSLIPVKNRMRYNYEAKLTTILCHTCNFLSYFDGKEYQEDSEKRNAKYILEKKKLKSTT